jgi:hypothetical protein
VAAENLPLGYLTENVKLASEVEIALANINKKNQESDDKRKARKVMHCVSNTVGERTTGPEGKAKGASKKKIAAKK